LTRKLYPYWDELFSEMELEFLSLEELSDQLRSAAPNRPVVSDQKPNFLQVSEVLRTKTLGLISSEFQMTIRSKVTLTEKSTRLLLWVTINSALSEGIDLTTWMTLYFLLESVRKSLPHYMDEKAYSNATKAVCLAELLLLISSKNGWRSLTEYNEVPGKFQEVIDMLDWLPNERTFKSWTNYYNPQKYLEIQIVPLEQILERSEGTERYSSYTKGYHESGKGYRRDGKVYGSDKGPRASEGLDDNPTDEETHHLVDEDPVVVKVRQLIQRLKENNFPGK